MKKTLSNYDKSIIDTLKNLKYNSEEGENIISEHDLSDFYLSLILSIISFIVCVILTFTIDWNKIIWLYIFSILFSFLSSLTAIIYFSSKKLPFKFLCFNSELLIKKSANVLDFFPLFQLEKVDYNVTNTKDEKYLTIILTINGEKLEYITYDKDFEKISNFLNKLIAEANKSKLIYKEELYKTNLYDLLANNGSYSSYFLFSSKKSIPLTLIISLIFIIAIPKIIDWNAYRNAVKSDTATSFREYLKEPKNKLFIAQAKHELEQKYDYAIKKYQSSFINSKSTEAIVTILRYLQNNEQYRVNIYFENINKVKDINKNYNVTIVSAENSLTNSKNITRQEGLISTLNQTFGLVFPSDIVSIEQNEELRTNPRIVLTYTYNNSKDGSLYYPADQEFQDDKSRTYYYGLTINWDFSLYLPDQENPIYQFNLNSDPAVQFSTESFGSDVVYTNMIYSAFNDFEDEFNKYFFTK